MFQVLRNLILALLPLLVIPQFVAAAERMQRPVLVGDSWSNGSGDWHNFTTSIPLSDYYNHSIGGETLSVKDAELGLGMAANIDDYLDEHTDADSLIIQGGINDIRSDVTSSVIADALVFMVNQARSRPNIADIVIIGPGPFGGSWMWNPDRQAELDAFLNWFASYCEFEGLVCYDTYASFGHPDNPLIISDGTNGAPDYNLDGLHLNLTGAAKLATDIDILVSEIRSTVIVQLDVEPEIVNTNGQSSDEMQLTVLGEVGFDATQVDSSTVRFGPDETPAISVPGEVVDTNNDGINDLRLNFLISDTGLTCQNEEDPPQKVSLTGETNGGLIKFEATGMATTDTCESFYCHQ